MISQDHSLQFANKKIDSNIFFVSYFSFFVVVAETEVANSLFPVTANSINFSISVVHQRINHGHNINRES